MAPVNNYWLCGLRSLAGLLVLLILAVIPNHGGKRAFTDKQGAPAPQGFGFRDAGRNSLMDNWIVARYLSDREFSESHGEKFSTRWEYVSLEVMYKVHNPTVTPMGVAGYLAAKSSKGLVNKEHKLLSPQAISKWIAVWNGTFESKGTGHSLDEKNEPLGELADARDANPSSVKSRLYLGPNASYHANRWYVSISPSIQLTHDDQSPDFSTCVIFGIAL